MDVFWRRSILAREKMLQFFLLRTTKLFCSCAQGERVNNTQFNSVNNTSWYFLSRSIACAISNMCNFSLKVIMIFVVYDQRL